MATIWTAISRIPTRTWALTACIVAVLVIVYLLSNNQQPPESSSQIDKQAESAKRVGSKTIKQLDTDRQKVSQKPTAKIVAHETAKMVPVRKTPKVEQPPPPDPNLLGKEKWVHLDLKGSAPKIPYLLGLIPVLKSWGVTGVLLEYEDMFPYDDNLKVLRTDTSYTKSDIQDLLAAIRANKMDPVPLIQTHGHMEFVLKHASFEALREDSRYPDFLNPAHPKAMQLLTDVIDQMMTLHGKLRYFHVGADEVGIMGESGESKQLMRDRGLKTADDLYLFHVKRVATYIQEKYPDVTVLVWDDMMRHMSLSSIQTSGIASLVEPVVWNYLPDITRNVDDQVWEKYAMVFKNIWTASAFKGASGPAQHLPDMSTHIRNHLSWLQTATQLRKTHPQLQIQGIVLTGWSRFDHFSALCELLPASLPSLAVCLRIIEKNSWTMNMADDVMEQLQCSVPFAASSLAIISFDSASNSYIYTSEEPHCEFKGNQVFAAMIQYHNILRKFKKYFDPITGKTRGHCNRFSMGHDFIDPLRVDNLCSKAANELLATLQEFKDSVHNDFEPIYTNDVITEWLEEHVINFEMWLKDYDLRVKSSAAKARVWEQRPDKHIDNAKEKDVRVVVPRTD